jgi:hypothetical protein
MVAVAALERWRGTVRALHLRADSDELRVSLRGLVAWYERLCVDGEYATPAPAEGMMALPQIALLVVGSPSEEIVRAWWAVRLAEEVVACRQLLKCGGDTSEDDLGVALSQLEVAMHGLLEH